MNTPILSDIKVLDNLLALNLNVNLWSARKKMVLEDFGGAELPPEDLASLGSKRIADPNSLKVFVTLKARAFNYLDRHGIRFMSGWAIPEDKAGDIIKELIGIRDEFLKEKDAFLADYDQSIENWINKHTKWASIIRESTVGSEYVRSRMGFSWQLYRVAPLMDHAVPIQIIEGTGFQSDEDLEAVRIGDTLGTQRGQIFRRKFRAAEVFQHHLLTGGPEIDVEIQGKKVVENLDVGKNGGIHDNSFSWLKVLEI